MNDLQQIAENSTSTNSSATLPAAPSPARCIIHQLLDCTTGIGRDYETFLNFRSRRCELIDLTTAVPDEPASVVLFIEGEISLRVFRGIRWIVGVAQARPVRCIVVVQSLSLHFGDPTANSLEALLQESLKPHVSSLTVIRTGFVTSPSSGTSQWLRRLNGLHRLLPARMTSTFVDGEKLFSVIDEEVHQASESWESRGPSSNIDDDCRGITILGQRRPWRDVAATFQSFGVLQRVLTASAPVLSLIGAPWLIFFAILLAGKVFPSLRQLHFHTLKPRSVRELISVYNRHNCSDVQIAGYNNGVNHFGWTYPHKTVVLTTSIPGDVHFAALRSSTLQTSETSASTTSTLESQAALVTVDSGLTLNHCIRELNKTDREFYVVPNYSWISMGTLFFVPVHGSGSRVSTLGDTIEHVLLYDGESERFVEAHRGDGIFRDAMYNRDRRWLLLKLSLRVKLKSKYFVRRSQIENPSAEEIQNLFNDSEASNVEVRKNKAASTAVDVCRYYIDTNAVGTDALEIPRDSIGRIWDRLEETPIVSTLFHWFVRTFAFHVELFLKPSEFVVFWDQHQSLPVSKIQLRRVLKDGMTHSACEHSDCISADLFMTRRNRDVFRRFIATHLPDVKTNPGKQSI